MVKLASKTQEKASLITTPGHPLTQEQQKCYSAFLKETDDFFHTCFKSDPKVFHHFAKSSSFKTLRKLLGDKKNLSKSLTSKQLKLNQDFINTQKTLLSQMLEKKAQISETCEIFSKLLKILASTPQSSKLSLSLMLQSLIH